MEFAADAIEELTIPCASTRAQPLLFARRRPF
jgi:hypothetical protein